MGKNSTGLGNKSEKSWDIVQQHVFFKPKEGQGWESKPELPTPGEILAKASELDPLPENPVDVRWPSKDQYLTAQYEILRHEATEGLRVSVRSFADHRHTEPMRDSDDTNIYTRVRVREYVMSTIGPLARVSFSTERAWYKIQWQQSKRLQPGKIVALSPRIDGFRGVCKLATVVQRPYVGGLDQDPPTVDLMWANPQDAVLDPTLELVMIESMQGYFESARHALVGLQHASRTDSPLDKYLTGDCTQDDQPVFLKDNPIMDISGLASQASPDDQQAIGALEAHDIVSGELPDFRHLTSLDESQLLGLHRIISKELAIVQGPPGTGKTFTSVEAIKTMVVNRRKRRGPPILVAAQTNHALDQILGHCIRAEARVLRMGGRTQSELIKPHTLFEQRQACRGISADQKCGGIDTQRRAVIRKLQELVDTLFSDKLLDHDALLKFGIITEAQHQSLTNDSMETHEAFDVHGPFALWLGSNLIPASLREDRHPTQLELDESEARNNLPEYEWDDDEAIENIEVDEDELFRFDGTTIQLKHVWSGKDPAHLTSWERAVRRALQKNDLFDIDINLRGAVYQHLQARLLEAVTPKFAALLAEYVELCKKRKAYKFLGNTQLVKIQGYDIVGCTTTGLSKYRGCLAAMQPVSLLIEEAAETREANVVSALYPSIQQLILVGDHKQLAPKCDIVRLGDAPYNLNVSLFERMVRLGMPYVMLNQQRRMKPELRALLNPFYDKLTDHPSVELIQNRPDVPGMGGHNNWLFDHTWPEDTNSDFSKFNEQEAEMIAHFFAYLVANGTPPEKITVLTFYKGQRKVLLTKLRRHPSIIGSTFNVCTVDSFQGEENDIILLSMVRSPQLDRRYAVGFLDDPRRAVVAISRARRGFYVFGNVDNVLGAHQASHALWLDICLGFSRQKKYDKTRGIPLVCQPHGQVLWIKDVNDWGDNAGGCNRPCKQMRHCGHPCTLKCHAVAHDNLPCGEPCREKLLCNHGCQRLCGQQCFCDCQVFKGVSSKAQTSQNMSLEQKFLQMGAEPDQFLVASMDQRVASRPQASVLPGLPPQQGQSSQGPPPAMGGHNWKPVSRRDGTALAAQTVQQWNNFVNNIAHHDAQLRQEHTASESQNASGTMIRESYQQTALIDGRRVGTGSRTSHTITMGYNQVAAGRSGVISESPVSNRQSGMNSLALAKGSHQIRPDMVRPSQNIPANNPPGLAKASEVRGKGPSKRQTKSARGEQRRVVEQGAIQPGPVRQSAPLQPPPTQRPPTTQNPFDSDDDLLIDAADPVLAEPIDSPETLLTLGSSSPLTGTDPLIPHHHAIADNAGLALASTTVSAGLFQTQGQHQAQHVNDEDEWLIKL